MNFARTHEKEPNPTFADGKNLDFRTNAQNDQVNHPSHYTAHPSGVEAIQVTRHMNFNLGNAMKYIWRAGLKDNAIQDLEKAVFYLNDEIQRLGGVPARQEKERAIRLAKMVSLPADRGFDSDYLYLTDFIEYLEDENEK